MAHGQPVVPLDRRMSARALARLLGSWHDGGPAYAALSGGIRRALLAGTLPLGTRLPSERELADVLGVSRTTTTAAYGALRDEGFAVSRQGSGTVTTLPHGPSRHDPQAVLDPNRSDALVDLTMAAPSAPSALHDAFAAALASLPEHLAGRGYELVGVPALRAAVAARTSARGMSTDPAQVLVTGGAQQALTLLLSELVGPGDRVVVEHPTYPNAIAAIRAAGARPVPVPHGPDGLDVDLLESTVQQVAPRLVYLVPDHHNPTGVSLSPAARERVRAIARRYRTVVVADETLAELTIDGEPAVPLAQDDERVVTLGSASKSFWGGLRIGWLRAHPDLVMRLAVARRHVDLGTAVLEQLVVAELLARADEILPARRGELGRRRDALCDLVARHLPGWRVDRPAGGLSLWADLGAPVSTVLASAALERGVVVAPGPDFGVDGSFEDRLRLPWTEPVERLERGVLGLAAAWESLTARDVVGPVSWRQTAVV